MQQIIVATDFSGDSMNALEHAIIWANQIEAMLRLVHVRRKSKFEMPHYFADLEQESFNDYEDILNHIIEKYSPKYQVENGRFDYAIREGKIYQEINFQIESDNADLVIMGTHGISGFEEYLLGSNAFRVVSKSIVPVVTIRNGYPQILPRRIVVPLDVTKQTRQKVPYIADIAMFFHAPIYILGVRETNSPEVVNRVSKYTEQVCEYLENKGLEVYSEVRSGGNITDVTIEYAKEVDADLIAIMTEQTERPENIWMGPYAQQMVNHSPIPVLSIQPISLNDPNKV